MTSWWQWEPTTTCFWNQRGKWYASFEWSERGSHQKQTAPEFTSKWTEPTSLHWTTVQVLQSTLEISDPRDLRTQMSLNQTVNSPGFGFTGLHKTRVNALNSQRKPRPKKHVWPAGGLISKSPSDGINRTHKLHYWTLYKPVREGNRLRATNSSREILDFRWKIALHPGGTKDLEYCQFLERFVLIIPRNVWSV